MRSTLIAAAILVAGAPLTANAQYGRLTAATDVFNLFKTSCLSTGPGFSTSIPLKAKLGHWDELGLTAKARPGDRGWLIAIKGQPSILDIKKPSPTSETCSVSAVTSPQDVVAAINKLTGKSATQKSGAHGAVLYNWLRSPKAPFPISVSVNPGQAMARITATSQR